MIFVTVGTAESGIDFTRLVREMDRMAEDLGQDVLIQRGPVDYECRHARSVRYLPFDRALDQFRQADLVVGHCGSGTVLNALRFRKPLVILPRRMDAGELNKDDHQMLLAREIEGQEGVYVVYETEGLEAAVREALAHPERRPQPGPQKAQLIAAVREFLGNPGK